MWVRSGSTLLAGLAQVQNGLAPMSHVAQVTAGWGSSIWSGNDFSERIWHFFFYFGVHYSTKVNAPMNKGPWLTKRNIDLAVEKVDHVITGMWDSLSISQCLDNEAYHLSQESPAYNNKHLLLTHTCEYWLTYVWLSSSCSWVQVLLHLTFTFYGPAAT